MALEIVGRKDGMINQARNGGATRFRGRKRCRKEKATSPAVQEEGAGTMDALGAVKRELG